MIQDWDIRPRHNACARCQTPFKDGQDCQTALYFSEQGYGREDCCLGCWDGTAKSGRLISAWRGEYVSPPAKPRQLVTRELIEHLLRDLVERGEAEKNHAVYLLAVMLERKRVLVEREVKTRPDGVKIRVYEHRKTGETFLVHDPELKLDELDSVRDDVMRMLEPPPPPEPAPVESAPAPPAPTAADAPDARSSRTKDGFYSAAEAK